ncbi:SPOR domain-containing protein [Xanthobacter autotrophicus DSM 431]|uniref:SPOR domain-containing protein n=1 Tax=Xanthobacter nonsaccharivorans TaxID=3119912 RepID=UPI00372A63A7
MRASNAQASSGKDDALAELARLIGDEEPYDDYSGPSSRAASPAARSQLPAQRQPAQAYGQAPQAYGQPQRAYPETPPAYRGTADGYADPRQAARAPVRGVQAAPAQAYDDEDDDQDDWSGAPQRSSVPAPVQRSAPPARTAPVAPVAPRQAAQPGYGAQPDSTVRLGYGSLARTAPARPAAEPHYGDEDDDYDPAPAPQAQAQGRSAAASRQPVYDERAYDTRGQQRGPAQDAYGHDGYDRDGYDRDGYDKDGYPRGRGHRDDDDEAAYAYSAERRDDDGYDDYDDTYDPDYAEDGYMPPHGEEVYDQEPRRRKGRTALLLGVSILGLLVAGAAGVFAYQMAVGKHTVAASSNGAPPVIKAEAVSTKTVTATPVQSADGQQKLIYDRLGATTAAGNERVVPREEQPVDVTAAVSKSAATTPPAAAAAVPAAAAPAPATANLNEPKKVRTLSVRADSFPGGGSPVSAYAANPGPTLPDPASAVAPVASATQTANALPTPVASGAFTAQVASQRTEADAQGSWKALQQSYPDILGGYKVNVKKVDLGDKGIFYRAQVGPFATRDQANQVCQALHARGGNCIVSSKN